MEDELVTLNLLVTMEDALVAAGALINAELAFAMTEVTSAIMEVVSAMTEVASAIPGALFTTVEMLATLKLAQLPNRLLLLVLTLF